MCVEQIELVLCDVGTLLARLTSSLCISTRTSRTYFYSVDMAPQKNAKKHQKTKKKTVSLAHPVFKASGILMTATVTGLSVIGPEKYGAIAAEVRQNFSLSAEAQVPASQAEKEQRIHQFSMAVVGGRSNIPELAKYQRVEAEIVARGTKASVILRVQKIGRNQPIEEYERAISEAYFSQVWQDLRDLEIAQLTNLSPYTEDLMTAVNGRTTFEENSSTYNFHFKDGIYDYPNSFEVHAPEH